MNSFVLPCVAVLSLFCGMAGAQAPQRAMSGTVTDSESGHTVAGVKVSVSGDRARADAMTDDTGVFVLTFASSVQEGTDIRVRAEKQGYVVYDQWITVSSKLPLNIALKRLAARMPKPGKGKPQTPRPPSVPAPEPIAIYLECEPGMYPITIPRSSTVHFMRLHPDFLRAPYIANFRGVGVFFDVSTPPDKDLEWPTKSDGEWLPLKSESGELRVPMIFKCDVGSYGRSTVEDISIPMVVQNQSQTKGRAYPIQFDPLTPNAHFPFYVVNWCSTAAVVVIWPAQLTGRVVGEPEIRQAPLGIIKRSWPGELMVFESSPVKWSGVQKCDWGW